MSASNLRIVFAGMVAGDPYHGGATWAVLQYVLGLRRLGHEVLLVEPVRSLGDATLSYFREVVSRFGLEQNAALLETGTRETAGLAYSQLEDAARGADVLLNVGGMLRDERLLSPVPVRVYVDLDPAFNQLWHEDGIDVGLDGHTHFVTVGLAVGRPGCAVPTCGRDWITTLQPVLLDEWRVAETTEYDGVTTVANWRGYGSIGRDGVLYGQKAHSVREFFDLPACSPVPVFAALAIHEDEERDLAALRAKGWRLLDPRQVAGSPERYRRFVGSSWAELGIAKSGYVLSRSGWFSDRSACYLASGRPVLAHDTGFGAFLPTGEGLLPFRTTEEAVAAIESIRSDYTRHSRAARELAEESFDSDTVLRSLLEAVGAA